MLALLPPEILVRIFEAGIQIWGIGFLAPVCLVCKSWNDLVATTPHLWGIITITRDSDTSTLHAQITRAKASPLTIISKLNHMPAKKPVRAVLSRVVSLSHNWVRADVSTDLLSWSRWSAMHSSLQELKISAGHWHTFPPDDFFNTDDASSGSFPKLHSLTARGVPKSWVEPFLSPSITYLDLSLPWGESKTFSNTLCYFSQVPGLRILKLARFRYQDPVSTHPPAIHLAKLITLEMNLIAHPSPILCQISAPSLQTLSIQHTPRNHHPNNWSDSHHLELAPLSPFLSQWSQGDFLPARLHTLELVECLQTSDVPYLIRWLARLPCLARLILVDDAIGAAAALPSSTEQTNIFRALASPQGAGTIVRGWLCPSLMQLHLVTDLSLMDLIEVAHARGAIASPAYSTSPLSRLRSLTAPLCPSGSNGEIQELKKLVDDVRCGCLACEFNLTI